MLRSVPQIVSMVAVAIGIALFGLTLFYIDLDDTLDRAGQLGLALPAILLPGTVWHLLRTWGWAVAFPAGSRPPFTRLFRVRLAADAVGFFTVRGLAGDPLKVVLLSDRVAPPVVTAAVALDRAAFAIIGAVAAGAISYGAVRQLPMPAAWSTLFSVTSVGSLVLLALLAIVVRRRRGDYVGRLVERLEHATGRHLQASRVVRFVLEVEDIVLALLRGDRRRLVTLTLLPLAGYALMALEVWLVLWAVGEPIDVIGALTIETSARLGSIASAAIPASLGALEASNALPVAMLGLGGGGALALTRRMRALLWAGLGLALYPRLSSRPAGVQPPSAPATRR